MKKSLVFSKHVNNPSFFNLTEWRESASRCLVNTMECLVTECVLDTPPLSPHSRMIKFRTVFISSLRHKTETIVMHVVAIAYNRF